MHTNKRYKKKVNTKELCMKRYYKNLENIYMQEERDIDRAIASLKKFTKDDKEKIKEKYKNF